MPQTKSYCWENPLFTIGTTLQTKLQLRALYLQKKKKKNSQNRKFWHNVATYGLCSNLMGVALIRKLR